MPWTKGTSGNPRGRPRKHATFADLIRSIGRTKDPETGLQRKKAVVLRLYEMALAEQPDLGAIRALLEWGDGRPAAVQVNVDQSGPAKTYISVSPDDWDEPV